MFQRMQRQLTINIQHLQWLMADWSMFLKIILHIKNLHIWCIPCTTLAGSGDSQAAWARHSQTRALSQNPAATPYIKKRTEIEYTPPSPLTSRRWVTLSHPPTSILPPSCGRVWSLSILSSEDVHTRTHARTHAPSSVTSAFHNQLKVYGIMTINDKQGLRGPSLLAVPLVVVVGRWASGPMTLILPT